MKHITFTTSKWLQMRIAVFFLLCLLCICLPTDSHAQTTRKKWKALKAQADTLEKYGKYEDALPLRIQEKDLALQKWGKWSKEYGTGAHDLGRNYNHLSNIDSAFFFTNEAMEVRKKVLGEKNIDYAKTLNLLAGTYDDMNMYDTAVVLYQQCLKLRKEILGTKHLDYANSLHNLGLCYSNIGKYDTALVLYQQCLLLRKELVGVKHPAYLNSLFAIAVVNQQTSKYNEALDIYEQLLNLLKEQLSDEKDREIGIMNNMAMIYQDLGKYSNALTLYKKCLMMCKENWGDKGDCYYRCLLNMGITYYDIGNYKDAMDLYQESLILAKHIFGENHLEYAKVLANIGNLHMTLGNYNEGLIFHEKSLNLRERLVGKTHRDYIQSIMNISIIYIDIGKYEQAKILTEHALLLIETNYNKEIVEYNAIISNLANVYYKMNDKTKSLELNNQLLTLGKSHPKYPNIINNLASIYGDIGNYDQAMELYQDALNLTFNTLGKKHPEYTEILYNWGVTYKDIYKYDKSLLLLQQCLSLQKELLGENHPKYANTINGIAILYWKMKNANRAFSLFSEGYRIIHYHYLSQSSTLSESDRTQFWATLKDNYQTYHSFCLDAKDSIPEVVAQAYNNQLNTAGILLQGTEKVKQAIQSSGDSSLLQLYETWRIQKKQIANWTTWDSLRLANSGIDLKAEEEKANDWEQELARKSVEFREATDTTAITWQEVQQSLQAGEAAVEIVRFRKYNRDFTDTVYYAALVLTPETKDNPIYVFLPNGSKMDSLWFNKYREYIEKHSKTNHINEEDTVHYARYLKAILAACGNATHIYFAADGVYHKLNLNTFWTEKGQYVAQQWQIHQLASTRELVKKNQEKPIPTQFTAALFGNPTFDMNKTEWLQATNPYHQTEIASTFRGGLEGDREENLKALPGAEAEVQAVGELLKNKGFEVKSYLNKMALEEEVQALKSPTIVLFATHGSFQKKASLPKSTGYNIANDPMYQSVLFFAGAKNTLSDSLSLENILATPQHEDGILHAAEAANLRLEGTELVVLSACETGLGQIQNGEGVYGLQRAFRIAGAKDLLMSLWKVDDQASKEFTTLFFQNWIDKKMAKYEAYRSTQLTLIQKYPHEPKKWGAFVLKESGR